MKSRVEKWRSWWDEIGGNREPEKIPIFPNTTVPLATPRLELGTPIQIESGLTTRMPGRPRKMVMKFEFGIRLGDYGEPRETHNPIDQHRRLNPAPLEYESHVLPRRYKRIKCSILGCYKSPLIDFSLNL